MSEPFRDEMSAALTRAEKLAEENRDLRDELQRLRATAHDVRSKSPDDALASQTLAVLDRLESATHVEPAEIVKAPDRVDPAALADLPKPPVWRQPIVPSPPRPSSGVSVRAFVLACLFCLTAGVILGALMRG